MLAKLTRERVDGVLVYPRWREPWCAQLAALPVVQTVTLPKVGPSGREEFPFVAGSRVESKLRDRIPYWRTEAALVRWPSPPPPPALRD